MTASLRKAAERKKELRDKFVADMNLAATTESPSECLKQMQTRIWEIVDGLVDEIGGKEPDADQSSPQAAAYRKAAKTEHEVEGQCEIDNGAIVSFGDNDGAYVAAWVWVNKAEAGICRTCGEVNADNGEGSDGECGSCADKAEGQDAE